MTIGKNKFKFGLKELQENRGPMTFARLLLSYRLSQELTQEALAKKLHLTKGNICDFEKGRKIPSPSSAEKMAKKLGEIQAYWIELVIQDNLRENNLNYSVTIKPFKKVA